MKKKRWIKFFICLFFIVSVSQSALAEKRVALVIGNSAYKNIPALDNPANDAKLIANVLEGQGFEVILGLDLKYRAMKRAIRRYTSKLQSNGRDTIGFIFYAGHGLQVQGTNYLIPVAAEIEKEGDVDIEAISASSLLFGVREARNRLNIIVLDACRNNPYRSLFRSVNRGLRQMNAPMGSLIAYSTSPGDVAADGVGKNSPFTLELAKLMQTSGLTIERVFKETRRKVYERSRKKQLPWINSSLLGDFYPAGANKKATSKPIPAVKSGAQPLFFPAIELAFWQAAKDQGSRRAYEAYVKKFPKGTFTPLALMKIEEFRLTSEIKAKQKAELKAARKRQNEAEVKKRKAEVVFRKKELDDLRLEQMAERNKLARERNALARRLEVMEEAAKKHAEAKEAQKIKLAALNPEQAKTEANAQTTPTLDLKAMTLVLQNELRRVGCDPGKVDGKWGNKGKKALSRFIRLVKLKIPTKQPSMEAINIVRKQKERVCPLTCGPQFRVGGDICVKKTCRNRWSLNKRGRCIKTIIKKPTPTSIKPVKSNLKKKQRRKLSKIVSCHAEKDHYVKVGDPCRRSDGAICRIRKGISGFPRTFGSCKN